MEQEKTIRVKHLDKIIEMTESEYLEKMKEQGYEAVIAEYKFLPEEPKEINYMKIVDYLSGHPVVECPNIEDKYIAGVDPYQTRSYNELENLVEDLECIEMYLDKEGVPRVYQAKELSHIERIKWLIQNEITKYTMERFPGIDCTVFVGNVEDIKCRDLEEDEMIWKRATPGDLSDNDVVKYLDKHKCILRGYPYNAGGVWKVQMLLVTNDMNAHV